MRPNKAGTMVAGVCALCFGVAQADELRVGVAIKCPKTGAQRTEIALAPVALALAGVVVQKLAGAALEKAADYLKDDTSITKTAYARAPRMLDAIPATDSNSRALVDAKGNPVQTARMSVIYACVYGAVGRYGNPGDSPAGDFTSLGSDASDALRKLGLQDAPALYFEGLYQQSKEPAGVYAFEPQFLYYGEHLKSGGLFGAHKRDLGVTIDVLKPSETAPISSSVISLEALKPGKDTMFDAKYFDGRPLPWQKVPALTDNAPVTIKVTVLETGKANTLDKALGEALAAKKDDLAQALADAVVRQPASGAAATGH
ncbi:MULTISPECIES: hypothetical protein [Burkholderia]|uniref:hypothetical protein n=1 Tax=Burkholderia TaxID=32008 RepID=UPI000F547296|nr:MULTISPECIES: hypothetical protein [Burkholderia]MBJ9661452.1 hypothetical protein [Burkholderia gladioli]MBU9218076.1 hypothetical protein [Burkholderia gladioli]MDN7727331.1 hypothetical protein [Burkholderia gladioli]NIE86770.1 hypothetical protein [Burkholderia sp. Tr-860]NIF63821.1 hypothetical protein [Burkholderia sp. Cy-647]